VILDEDTDALFRVGRTLEAWTQAIDDGAESVFLNQVQQLVFGREIVVKAGQRHSRRPREIAHGSAFVPFFAEDAGRVLENSSQPAIEAAVAELRRSAVVRLAPVDGRDSRPGFERIQGHIWKATERSFEYYYLA